MNYLIIAQAVIALLLSGVILIQQQGAGLGGAFGGEGNVYRSRRGVEKVLFYGTIVLAIIFFAISIYAFITNK
jgi:preprotein translocase subunit SecG